MLKALPEGSKLIGIDRDDDALAAASKRLAPFGDKFTAVKGNFCQVKPILAELGIPGIDLQRKMFDAAMAAKGYTNTVTARGVGLLLERMAQGRLLGAAQDGAMVDILLNQRLNGKLPFYLHSEGIRCAHKTGEDDGITHDVGIVYAEKPFVVCMLSNNVDVPAFERLMQDAARELALGVWQP